LNAEQVPGIRLRATAQTFQQSDCLYITDPARFLSPLASSLPPLFFEPPMSSVSREEELDDVFCALDLLSFDPAADLDTSYVLKSLVVDRIPTDALEWTTPTLVREYKFGTSVESWSLAGAPEEFTMPDGTYDPTSGTLILRATNNTNCFGYWHSNPDDCVTSSCGELYRATFEVHSDITDRTKVPEIRFRINTEDGQLGVSHSIQSTIDSEMSPYFDAARPARTFTYNIYLWKPPAAYQDKLILSCDLLNFSPFDSASGSIILDSARVTKHPLPQFPMDRGE
jgi:hypothetical protein